MMAPVAYGPLQLKPWELGRLTPGELRQLIDGYVWRREAEEIMAARFVAPIINTCTPNKLKKSVTVEMLLGYDPAHKTKTKITTDQAKEEMQKLIFELWGVIRWPVAMHP